MNRTRLMSNLVTVSSVTYEPRGFQTRLPLEFDTIKIFVLRIA